MNITTTKSAPIAAGIRSQEPTTKPKEKSEVEFRPAVDWWEVTGERYEDTSALLQAMQKAPGGAQKATYHFVTLKPQAAEKESNLSAGTTGALQGALATAAVAGGGALAMNVLMGLGYVLSAGMGGEPNYIDLASKGMGLLVGAGAAVGAGMGIYNNNKATPTGSNENHAQSVTGTISTENGPDGTAHPTFYINNDVTRKVDLKQYAQADPLPDLPAIDVAKSRKESALKGLASGGSAGIPILGYFKPMVDYAEAGASLDGFRGGVAGTALGIGSSALPWVGAHAAGGVGYAIGTAASAAIGGIAGYTLGPAIQRATQQSPEAQSQWWAQAG